MYYITGLIFDGCTVQYSFEYLNYFILGCCYEGSLCKQYCDEHWHDENLNWNVLSNLEFYKILKKSSYHNPLNIGLLKFLVANETESVYCINSVENYERKFSCTKIEDLDFIKEITVNGNSISRSESTSIVSTLLENEVTMGQLWNVCKPRINKDTSGRYDTLILDASESLMEFYYSIKVSRLCT